MAEEIYRAYMPFLNSLTPEPVLIGTKNKPIPRFPETKLIELCEATNTILEKEPPLLKLHGDYFVVGDLHGNIIDLLRILSMTGSLSYQKYIFLGDYVDRGEFSVEVVTLLFALKNVFPNSIYLLRGNHEFQFLNSLYGFKDEILAVYGEELFNSFNRTFSYLPVAAVINNHTFCVHGGLSPVLKSPEDIMTLQKPIDTYEDNQLLNDLLWSDPAPTEKTDFVQSPRGKGYLFGLEAVTQFLNNNNLKRIIRAHQCVPNGIEKVFGDKLYTVFSTSSDSEQPTKAGVIFISRNGAPMPSNFPPIRTLRRSMCSFHERTNSMPMCKRIMMNSQSQSNLDRSSLKFRRRLPYIAIPNKEKGATLSRIRISQSKPTF